MLQITERSRIQANRLFVTVASKEMMRRPHNEAFFVILIYYVAKHIQGRVGGEEVIWYTVSIMDHLTKILQGDNVAGEVELQKEQDQQFEQEVEALIDLYHFIEEHPDEVTKKIMKFMPPVHAKVMAEATKRLRKKLGGTPDPKKS